MTVTQQEPGVGPGSPLVGQDEDVLLWAMLALYIGNGENFACSYAQRKLGIGYNIAAKQQERMEDAGILSLPNNVGKRTLLVSDFREAGARLTKGDV